MELGAISGDFYRTDVLVFPAQFGRPWIGKTTNEVQAAIPEVVIGNSSEFALEFVTICCELITQPERLLYPRQGKTGGRARPLNIIVGGCEIKRQGDNDFHHVPTMRIDVANRAVIIDCTNKGSSFADHGVATGWLPMHRSLSQ